MSAILRIGADPADVRRAFSALGDEALRVNRRLQGIEREQTRNHDRTLAEEQRANVRAANKKVKDAEEAAKKQKKIEDDRQQYIQRVNANLAKFLEKKARERTQAEERESKKRQRQEREEAKEAERLAEAKLRHRESVLRRETQAAERQARNEYRHHYQQQRQIQRDYREQQRNIRQQQVEEGRTWSRSAGRGMAFAQHVIGAAGAATSEYLSSAAGARATYGDREHTLNAALVQANISGTDAVAARQRISNFLVSGQGQGINGDELASALLATQTQTNILARRGGLETFLSNAQLAASTYEDVGEVTRIGGVLGSMGITGADQRAALLSFIGEARTGAISLGAVSSEALQGVKLAIGQELGANPNVTGAARSQLISQTAAQAFAVTQIGAGQGLTPRDSLNAYNKLNRALTNENTVENLRDSLHSRYNDRDFKRYDAELFEEYRDARGERRHRLRNTDPLQFGQRLTEIFGGNTSAMLNAMAGSGGPGGGMVFDSQTRRLLGAMTGRDDQGKTGWQRIKDLSGVKTTEEEVQAGADLLASEKRTVDTQTEERRLQGLMNQPTQNAVTDINAYRAEHPWMSAFVRGVTPWGMGEVAEMGVAKMMGFAGAVPGGQNTQRGVPGAAPSQSVPVTLDERSLRGLADTLRNSPLRATVDPTQAAIHSGQNANLATPPEARTH